MDLAIRNLSINLRTLRKRNGYTIDSLSVVAGVGKTQVWNIEKGKSEHVELLTILKLARALNVNVEMMIADKLDKNLFVCDLHPDVAKLITDINKIAKGKYK